MSLVIYIDNHNVIELQTLTNSATGVVDTAATVTVTLYDSSGDEVAGQTWPASMSHVSGGTYRATLDSDLTLATNTRYRAVVSATGTGSEVGKWDVPVVAEKRTS